MSGAPVAITAMTPERVVQVLDIHRLGIDESQAPLRDRRPAAKLPAHRHIALDEAGRVPGWVAATDSSSASAT